MAETYLLVDANDNVVNAVVWDGAPGWQPSAGLRAVKFDGAWGDGWKWNGIAAYDPNPAPPPESRQPPSAPPVPGMTVV